MSTVKISPGNSKLGAIPSVSLPALKTCRSCACNEKCYALKLERIRKTVREAYQHNLEVLTYNNDTYWREVEASIMMTRYFRFHVSGDIPDRDYLEHMIRIAKCQQHCEILCFTKKFEMVNEYIETKADELGINLPPRTAHGRALFQTILPNNLHLIFSAWPGLEMKNPYNLPEAHVRFRDGTTTARTDAVECSGNCTECATTDDGCWVLKNGEQVVFNEH